MPAKLIHRKRHTFPDGKILENERPKGDHRHYGNHEEAYHFTDVNQLMTDFLNDVTARRDDL